MTDATNDHAPEQHAAEQHAPQDGEQPTEGTVLGGDLTAPLSTDTQSGEADYVATNAGGVSAERGNPLPEDEQGRGTEYDPADQAPQLEG